LVPVLAAAAGGETRRRVVVFTPGAQPLNECAIQLAAVAGVSAVSVRADLVGDPINLHLRVRQVMADRAADDDLVLVVDQFEEVFTLCSDRDERSWFIEALITAAGSVASRTRLVLGVRADFYGHCAHHPGLVDALRDGQVMVGPMTADELRQAITGPALRASCRVETALVSRLIADATGQPAVLPLVSHALLETWNRRHGTTLTLAAYQTAGGMHHALARTAETTYNSLDLDQQRLSRQLFQRLTALGEGTEDTKRRIRDDELDHDDPNTTTVLNALARARLITLDRDSIELAHEALIRHWPRLRDWLAEDRDGLRIHRQLTDDAHTWQALDRDPGALYRGARLARAHEWADTTPDLTTRERQFLEASWAAQAAEQATAQRRSRRSRQLIALLAVLLMLTTSATVYAIHVSGISTRERNHAIIAEAVNEIAILSRTANYKNQQLARALSLAAYNLDPNPRTRGSLISSYATLALPGFMAFSPDGKTLANVLMSTSIELYDMTDPARHKLVIDVPGLGEGYTPTSARFDPDGNTLMITESDRTVLLDSMSYRHVTVLPGKLAHDQSIASDGKTLALIHEHAGDPISHTVRLVDISNPGQPTELSSLTHDDAVRSAVFSPDGHTLAATSLDGTIQLWDIAEPQHPTRAAAEFSGHAGPATLAVFSPDGRTLVTGEAKTIRLWDIANTGLPTQIIALPSETDPATPSIFSPDGRILVTYDTDQASIVLWDVGNPHQPTRISDIAGPADLMPWVVFSHDSRTLAAFGADGTITLWDVANPRRPAETAILSGNDSVVSSATFSPDGQTLVTASHGSSQFESLWEISADRIEARACEGRVLPVITPTEWGRYFPGLPFQKPCR